MTDPSKSPFDILGILSSADLVVINAAYRALARKYHSDLNPGVPPAESNRRMAELNWAKEELERNLEQWRQRAEALGTSTSKTGKHGVGHGEPGSTTGQSPPTPSTPRGTIQVQPQVIILAGRKGVSATFSASAAGLEPMAIRSRFKESCFSVERLPALGPLANFKVTVTDDFASDIEDNLIETVEVVAPGFPANKVFVSIAPLTSKILSQQYGQKVAPPRHASPTARISFGKHRGRTFREIAVEDPGYLEWMLREGAGSRVERACAQMALNELRGGTTLRESRRPATPAVKPAQQPAKPKALPDPRRSGSLWEAVKTLFRGA